MLQGVNVTSDPSVVLMMLGVNMTSDPSMVLMMQGVNVTSDPSVVLEGLVHLSGHWWLFVLFLLLYVFVLLSDSLVVYIICSHRSLCRPMFVFVAAVLVNSLAASTAIYPKLLLDLAGGRRPVLLPRSACLCQALVVGSLGSSGFMLLSAMAFDRYLSICRPLRYAALMSPATVATLLLLCWLLPLCRVGGAVFLAARLPLCHLRVTRIYCDMYSFVSMSCGGGAALLSDVYGLVGAAVTVFLPLGFVLFSYGRVLTVCLTRSRSFSGKALRTCLPHVLVFLNFSLSAVFELIHRRMRSGSGTVTASILVVVVPTVLNPVVYGLKVAEIHGHIKNLLQSAWRTNKPV